MRKTVIAGNWKMHKTLDEAKAFMTNINEKLEKPTHTDVIVCAPFPFLSSMSHADKVLLGAQNMHYETSGAFTGEVSPIMLQHIGVQYVIIGHSERRMYFNETDDTVNKKLHAAFKHGLRPILCVGESLEQYENGETEEHIKQQVKKALRGLSDKQISKTIIAYEPIWAIGTGKTATSEQANEVCKLIRSVVSRVSSIETSDDIIIQYGGSVKPDNIGELLAQSDIDGALVGGASLEVDSFLELIRVGAQ